MAVTHTIGPVDAKENGRVAVHVDGAGRVAVLDAVGRVRTASATVLSRILEQLNPSNRNPRRFEAGEIVNVVE